jgi:hypothetical protein
MAIYSNLSIDQGADFSSNVSVENANGGPADLTGYTAFGQIRKTHSSTNATDFIATIPFPAQGQVSIKLTITVTNAMKPGRYVYDIEIKNGADGTITRVLEGQVEVTPGVTRSI